MNHIIKVKVKVNIYIFSLLLVGVTLCIKYLQCAYFLPNNCC